MNERIAEIKAAIDAAIAQGNAEEIVTASGRKIVLFSRRNLEQAKSDLRNDILRHPRRTPAPLDQH